MAAMETASKPKKRVPLNLKDIKRRLQKECDFIKNVFSVLPVPSRMADDQHQEDNYVYVNPKHKDKEEKSLKRALSITELQQRLAKVKQDNNFTLKNKLIKKSLTTKLAKKARKAEQKQNKQKNKTSKTCENGTISEEKLDPSIIHRAKPVFNSDGRLVFSKFDFTNAGKKGKKSKLEKDPKRLLDNIKKQQDSVKKLQESGNMEKAAELKQKIAWKNALAKAEGDKVKDDPLLLKKSLKRMEQQKKQSQKKWEERIKKVDEAKKDRQKKRQENINKKKKDIKAKKLKNATKRGRIIL